MRLGGMGSTSLSWCQPSTIWAPATSGLAVDDFQTAYQQEVVAFFDTSALVKRYLLETGRIASNLAALLIVSADLELNAAATAEGVAVEDPNAYP